MKAVKAVALGGRVQFIRHDGALWEGRVWSLAPGGYWVIPDGQRDAVMVRWSTISRSGTPEHQRGRKLRESVI